MKKSLMSNIKQFVDSNVRQRIDRVAHNNNEFFSGDLLLLERHFDDIRQLCFDLEKKMSSQLQSIQTTPSLGAYTQNVQAGLSNLSHNIATNSATITNINSNSNSNTYSFRNFGALSSSETLTRISPNKSTSPSESCVSNSNQSDYQIQNPPSLNQDSTNLNSIDLMCNSTQQKFKKLPMIKFLRFLTKSNHRQKADSLLSTATSHCSQMQVRLVQLFLNFEQTIEAKCLKPIHNIIDNDIPNVIKLRKLFIKSYNDLESIKAKHNGASQKQQQLQANHSTSVSYTMTQSNAQQACTNKLDHLKKELDEAEIRFEQAKDTYEAELYAFLCREPELVNLLRSYYEIQAEYHKRCQDIIQDSIPTFIRDLTHTPRKPAFGTLLDQHLRFSGRPLSPVIEICVHLLHTQGLQEEGLFRIPGSSVKIKKLKNAINAWFITLADQESISKQTSIVAILDLFDNTVGHRQQTQSREQSDLTESSNVIESDSSTLKKRNVSPNPENSHLEDTIFYDNHSIAGLLKLYLRELAEPLFTYSSYDKWINAASIKSIEERLRVMESVIINLPTSHRENLKYLIRFLNLLAGHQDQNKMTSTNLAIAMAPSLIWPKSDAADAENTDDLTSLSNQISSVGYSASQHALVLEGLINNAERLFPGPVDFTLSDVDKTSNEISIRGIQSGKDDRNTKSTSPTNLSVVSSSSSSSSGSAASSQANLSRDKKAGSMEGLHTSQDHLPKFENRSKMGRPVSVMVRTPEDLMPSSRQNVQYRPFSRPGANTEEDTPKVGIRKPPPPIPPHPNMRNKRSTSPLPTGEREDQRQPPAMSLRGTGTLSSQNNEPSKGGRNNVSQSSSTSMRPTVPPPNLPVTVAKFDHIEYSEKPQTIDAQGGALDDPALSQISSLRSLSSSDDSSFDSDRSLSCSSAQSDSAKAHISLDANIEGPIHSGSGSGSERKSVSPKELQSTLL